MARRCRRVKRIFGMAKWIGRRSNGIGEVEATGARAAEAKLGETRPRKVRRRGWRGLGVEAHWGAGVSAGRGYRSRGLSMA